MCVKRHFLRHFRCQNRRHLRNLALSAVIIIVIDVIAVIEAIVVSTERDFIGETAITVAASDATTASTAATIASTIVAGSFVGYCSADVSTTAFAAATDNAGNADDSNADNAGNAAVVIVVLQTFM